MATDGHNAIVHTITFLHSQVSISTCFRHSFFYQEKGGITFDLEGSLRFRGFIEKIENSETNVIEKNAQTKFFSVFFKIKSTKDHYLYNKQRALLKKYKNIRPP